MPTPSLLDEEDSDADETTSLLRASDDKGGGGKGNDEDVTGRQLKTVSSSSATSSTFRLDALDAFRGICLFNMIIGDYAYGVSKWLKHSPWQGMTYDDPTFPSFVFVMGCGIGLSMGRMRDPTKGRERTLRDTLIFVWRRALSLVGLNLIFQGWYQGWNTATVRIPGVLFRLGWCYGIVTTICVALPVVTRETYVNWIRSEANKVFANKHKKTDDDSGTTRRRGDDQASRVANAVIAVCDQFRDVVELAPQWLAVGAVYGVWIMFTYGLPVPCGGGQFADVDKLQPVIGYTGPGGLADDDFYYWCTAGAQAYIDRLVLGENHVQQRRLVHCTEEPSIMCPRAIDDLGILGTLAACVSTMLGVQAAVTYLRMSAPHGEREVALERRAARDGEDEEILANRRRRLARVAIRWSVWGLVSGIAASVMCSGCNWFDFTDNPSARFAWIPIVKITWSPSFICAMACIDFFELLVLGAIIDAPSFLYRRPAKTTTNGRAAAVETNASINRDVEAPSKSADDSSSGAVSGTNAARTTLCERYAPYRWRGFPFRSLGRNSILFYMACLMCASWIPFLKPAFFELDDFNLWQRIASSLLSMCVWFVIARVLDAKKWYWVVGREEWCSR